MQSSKNLDENECCRILPLKNKALVSICLTKSSRTIHLFYIHMYVFVYIINIKHGTKLIVVVFPILLQLLHYVHVGEVKMDLGIIGPSRV